MRLSTQRTALVVEDKDRGMSAHLSDPRFRQRQIAEVPERLDVIQSFLEQTGLFQRCKKINAQPIALKDLESIHQPSYIESILSLKTKSDEEVDAWAKEQPSVDACQSTPQAALLAAGAACQLVDEILTNKVQNGFCLSRPPGHHSSVHSAEGFCFFNNVALAANFARKHHGLTRVAICDIDVHFGDGLSSIFYETNEVLFISLHRHDGRFYPGKREAEPQWVGRGKGAGFNVNIAWPTPWMGDPEYLHAFREVVLPILREYQPELILISCGFDAARGDPLGQCLITPYGYAEMIRLLSAICPKLAVVLEGGYNLDVIPACAHAVVKSLLGLTRSGVTSEPAQKTAVQAVDATKDYLAPYWKCLAPPRIRPRRGEENPVDLLEVSKRGFPCWFL